MKFKPKIASRHTAPLRRVQLFAISLVIVLLSSVVIARDARFKRVDGHAIGSWAGSDSVDAIIAARDHDLYHREDAELIARADDDNNNDNDESKKPDDSQKDTNDGVGDDKNDVGQPKGDEHKDDGQKDNKQDAKNDEHKDDPKDQNKNDDQKDTPNNDQKDDHQDAPKDPNDNKNDDQKDTPNNDQKDDKKDDQKDAPKNDQPEDNKNDHQDSPKPNDDQKEDQNNQPDDADKKNNPSQETKTEEEKQPQPTETKNADDKDSTTDVAPKTTDPPKTTDQPQPTKTEDDKKTTKAPETTKTKDADATKTTEKVRVTVSTKSNGHATTIDLPTLYPGGITALPQAQVPPTANAPYRQSSKYPEGFIFIIVGSIIGFAFACVLLWNVIIAWSLNRSVRRTAGSRPAGSSATGDNETDPMMFPFRRRAASTSKGAATESTRPKRGRRRSTISPDVGSPYADVPLAKGPMVETRPRRDTTDGVSPLTVMPTSHARQLNHQRSQPLRNASSLYFSPTANPGAHDVGPRRQYDGGHLSAGYYPATPRSNPTHSRHTSRSHLPPSPGKRTTSPGKRTTSPGKRNTSPGKRSIGSGRLLQPGSASQGQMPPTQPLPLSAQHLQHLDMLDQEQQQQQAPQQYLSPHIRSQYGGAAPAPGMLSPNPPVPVRGPSMLLDDLLGSGVSIAGSGPETRGYTNDGGNDDDAGRGERSRRDGRR